MTDALIRKTLHHVDRDIVDQTPIDVELAIDDYGRKHTGRASRREQGAGQRTSAVNLQVGTIEV